MPLGADDWHHVRVPAAPPPLTVVGIGADGWECLVPASREALAAAATVLGSPRQLDLLPTAITARRVVWPTPLREGLPELLASLEPPVVALASGDPLVAGVGSTLIDLGIPVTVLPHVSSAALARARMGWPAESCAVVRVARPDAAEVRRELAPGRRVLVLSRDATTPGAVAVLLKEAGFGATRMTVLGDLGSAAESREETTAEDADLDPPPLHVLALEIDGEGVASWAPGLPDDAYEHDGQLTKRDVRAAALARLAPVPGQLLWDVGAGAGSVGIEWMRAHPGCRAVAVESHPERVARNRRNAVSLGVPGLTVVEGHAPAALDDLPRPDAVFVGGGATRDGVLDACLRALSPGGRLVVHGVTLETEALLAARHAELGGELTRISVETADAVGSFRGWAPARTVTQWCWVAPPDRR